MFGIKSKSAAEKRRDVEQYVIVQTLPHPFAPDPQADTYVSKSYDHDAALRVFAGVLTSVPAGTFQPHTGARLRVMALSDYVKTQEQS
jgi:hypothetical protein